MVPRCYRSLLVVAYVTVWARPPLAREPVGVLLCSHSSQSSSGTGWVYSARGGIGRHARFRLWCPSRRVGLTPTGRTSGRGFRSFLLPLTLHSCYSVSERGSPDWLNW